MPRRYSRDFDLGEPYNGRSSDESGGAWFFWLLAGAIGGFWLAKRTASVNGAVGAPAAQNGSEQIEPQGVVPKTRPLEFVQASNFWIDRRVQKSEPHRGDPMGEDELYPYLGDTLDLTIDEEADFGGIPTSVKQADLTVKGYLPVK